MLCMRARVCVRAGSINFASPVTIPHIPQLKAKRSGEGEGEGALPTAEVTARARVCFDNIGRMIYRECMGAGGEFDW